MKSFLTKIYLFKFFDDFLLVYPVYTLIFKANGLNYFHISLLLAIWSGTVLVLEVPTGILADKYNRKYLLVIGEVLKAIGYLFWFFGNSFYFFALGFIFWGLKSALTSGTFESYVYDELKYYNHQHKYDETLGKIKASKFLGITLAMTLGGILASIDFKLTIIPSVVSLIFAAIIISSTKSVLRSKSTQEVKYLTLLKQALIEAKSTPTLLRLILYSILVIGSYGAVDEYWALLYDNFGLTVAAIGFMFAIGNCISSVAGLTYRYFSKIKNTDIYFLITSSILICISGLLNNVYAVIFIFLATYFIEISVTKIESKIQHTITSNQRATVTSINSLLLESVVIIFSMCLGYLSTKFGIVTILYLLSFTLVAGVIVSKLKVNR